MRSLRGLLVGAVAIAALAFAAGSLTSTGDHAHDQDAPRLAAAAGETADGSSVNTCTLVTESEASSSLGADVATVPDPGQCTYVATDGTGRALSIAVPDQFGHKKDFAAGVEQAANAYEGTHQAITAGDEAYAIISPMISQGFARVGDSTYVIVVLTNPAGTADEQSTQLTTLLQTAISRL